MIEIPWQSLDPETLEALLEEIVTRDGTDYGAKELSKEQKTVEARHNLEAGRAVLVWDEATETSSLIDRRDFSG